jgi:putative IMPACT (imprinted ancient) family translation regulator
MERFLTLAGRAEAELEERGSRFLAIAVPVRDRAGAERFHAAEAHAHRNPTHVVPAFRLHDGTAYASDAGEPAGSAGQPLLAVLEGAGLADVAAVCVRWYGGTKLGVGGLVRAYGGALARALEGAPTRTGTPAREIEVRYAHRHTGAVLRAAEAAGGSGFRHAYEADAAVLSLLLPRGAEDALARALADATAGEVVPAVGAEAVILA